MLWPVTVQRDDDGALRIGGVSLTALAANFGTPLYVYDVATIRAQCRRYRSALSSSYERSRVVYAGKAGLSLALLAVIADESVTYGRGFFASTKAAPPHDWLNVTGGAIGGGMPMATGAATFGQPRASARRASASTMSCSGRASTCTSASSGIELCGLFG